MSLDRDRVALALPGYEIGDEIGRGAWGIVLRARHRQLGREVAVKELPQAFAADPGVRRRFVSEARLLATLDHPHIVPIYDYVESEGLCLLVMELLSGGTLWDRFLAGGVPADVACSIVLAACGALEHSHTKGILHRDIKPENLLFTAAGTLKVSDFGIAKVVGGVASMATRTGEVLGTPAYMAPEQALGHELTPATDVYAVGTVLYELLSGRLPFVDDGNAIALLYRHVHEQPMLLADVVPDLPPAFTETTMRALAAQPGDRFVTAEDFGVALADAATGAWGPGWVQRCGVQVMAAGRIGERISGSYAPSGTAAGFALSTNPAPSVRAPATVVEAAATAHGETGFDADVASPDELVPLEDIVRAEPAPPPAPPTVLPAPGERAPSGVPTGPGRPSGSTASTSSVDASPVGEKRTARRRPLMIVLGVLVLLAVAGGVLFALGNSGSQAPHRSAATKPGIPAVSATISVGKGADHVASGADGIFVTNNPGRALARVAPDKNTASSVAALGDAPHAVAVGSDAVWLTASNRVLRVEPATDPTQAHTTTIPVDTSVAELAVGDGGVWVTAGQSGQLIRIDPKTRTVAARIDVGAAPDSVVVGEGGVWVANRVDAGTVTRVDPTHNRVLATVAVGSRPDQIAIGAGSVWTANSGDGTVSRIDPATDKVVATIKVGRGPASIVVGAGAVWVSDKSAATVYRIDPATNRVTGSVRVGGGPESSTVADSNVWVVNTSDGTVSRIDPTGAAGP
jgi:YVTN family beta-propeller protein